MKARVLVAWLLVLLGSGPSSASSTAGTARADSTVTLVVPLPGEVQELVLRDGTRAAGRIERVEGGRVLFRTTAGAEIAVEASQIAAIRSLTGELVDGEYRRPDPNPTRLFFGPTARSVPAGTGYLGVFEILLPFVQVGLTDRISLGGGTPLIFGEETAHPFWLTPKVQVLHTGHTQAAVGAFWLANVEDGTGGVVYGVVTRGRVDAAITVAAGYALASDMDDVEGGAVLMLGGERRVSRGLKLITENYLWNGGGLASAGIRLLGERLSADLGLVAPLGAGVVFAFPVVNFVWRFGGD
ncbi:MAG: hypothetical protein WDA75_02520 [Candidatus Latescibacterota bacterium]|jgi:hypothetical protein